jgi:formylmethanofuran dehydrogenase subunit C
MRIELEFHSPGGLLADLAGFHPSEVLSLSSAGIEKLRVPVAGKVLPLAECFRVSCSDEEQDELVLSGDTSRIISAGQYMASGRLVIRGEAGPNTAAQMSGGELEVFGDSGDNLAVAMCGGLVRVHGRSGDWCGAALPGQSRGMTGGIILVEGDVGTEAGAGMRRGLLVIAGNSGAWTGTHMLAGTILCLGRLGTGAGVEMIRGSLVAGSSEPLLPGIYPAGEADPEWLLICLEWLRRLGLPDLPAWDRRIPQRYIGDHLLSGRGEILLYDILE